MTQEGRSPTESREPSDCAISQGVAQYDGRGRPDMERFRHANEETALNPDPFDLVAPDFVTPALVGLGTMRQGSMRLLPFR